MSRARPTARAAASDADDRRRIETDLDTTLVVEAAAGTGKTSSLVTRAVALVRTGRARMGDVAAVTFTKKAAAQLRERITARLDAGARASAGDERRRLFAARDEIDRAFVGTIHAFCARLLRERPVEAGIDPEFQEADEDMAALLREEAWSRALERLRRDPGALARLEDLGVDPFRLHDAYERILDYPDLAIAATPVEEPDLSPAVAETNGFLDAVLPTLRSLGRSRTPDALAAAAWAAHYFRENRNLADPVSAAGFLAILRDAKATQRSWPDRAAAKKFSDRAKELQQEWIEPALDRWYAHCHEPVMRFLGDAAADFREARIRAGQPGFTDLLLLARDMLRDHEDVRRHFRDRYRYVLVDEFQDTDPIQAEIILYLTAACPAPDWRRLRPVPGSLFIVGDPKQSIYRFRRADIDVYETVRDLVEASGGATVRLSASFRSAPAVCDHVNGVFDSLFARGVPHQAENVPLVPRRPSPKGTIPSGVFAMVSRVAGQKHGPAWEEDARCVAEWISAAIGNRRTISLPADGREIERPATPGDFLVILRNAGRLDLYARALETAGVPATVAGGKAFRDSEEVQALLPFLRAIADPDDPVPVVAFLRGPFCGVDDDALYRFRSSGGKFSFRAEPPPGGDARITAAFERLRRGREWVRVLPPGSAIGRIVEDLGILPAAYADAVGDRRAGNLEKTLTLARRLSGRRSAFAEIVESIGTLVEEGEAAEMSIEPVREDAVRVTNLHKAKGLEAPVVFLAGPLSDSRGEGPCLFVDRAAVPPRGHFLIRNDSGVEVARPAEWTRDLAIENAQEAAEKSRLLYVAATRAMDTLVISGSVDTTTKARNIRCGPWADLVVSALADLPGAGPPPAAAAVAPFPTVDERDRAIAAIDEAGRAARTPTFAVSSPSKFDAGVPSPTRERTGRGMSWGRVLHRLLESLMRGTDGGAGSIPPGELEKLAENLLREEDRPADELPELLRVVDRVRASEPWVAVCAAARRFVEVPFAAVVRSREYGLPEPPGETLLNGTIDLVYREDDAWKLIDYKSDALTVPVSRLVAAYAPQLRAYREQWERLTGETTRAGLLFLEDPSAVHWL